MSGDLSNNPAKNRLPRSGILRGKDSFDRVFRTGTRISGLHVDLKYCLSDDPARRRQVAFVAGRKLGNAVRRNRCKRLLREAYRLRQHLLDPVQSQYQRGIQMIYIAKSPDLTYQSALKDVNKSLDSLLRSLTAPGARQTLPETPSSPSGASNLDGQSRPSGETPYSPASVSGRTTPDVPASDNPESS